MNHRLLCAVLLGLLLAPGRLRAERQANPAYEPADPFPFGGYPNLFLKAKVSVSGQFWFNVAELAVNGNHAANGEHWAADHLPAWLKIGLVKDTEINAIRLWTYWDDERSYQYLIEGSPDGKSWATLVDERDNRIPSTAEGRVHMFPARSVRHVRATFTGCSAEDRCHIVEIEGYRLDDEVAQRMVARERQWKAVPAGLHGAIGSTDTRYPRQEVPVLPAASRWSGTAWRGERMNAQIVLWSAGAVRQVRLVADPLRDDKGHDLGSDSVVARFVRYVLAEGRPSPDILDTTNRLDLAPCTARPVWVSLNIPREAEPGTYKGRVIVTGAGAESLSFELQVRVLPLLLPAPRDWAFHLDLWQNPYAVARYHHVAPWSEEHRHLLEPHLRMLAEAGQKCLTTTIVHRPWGTQTFDPYDSMVEWSRSADGSWRYDFAIFDRYVAFGARCGLDRQITCYSMVPWSNSVRYLDEKTGEYRQVVAVPGRPEYEQAWQPFLRAFRQHLRERGWLNRTAIGMDERPVEVMKPVIALIRREAPELRIALAGSNEQLFADEIDDWSIGFGLHAPGPDVFRTRRERGRQTTFYVCCGPDRPNTFSFSPPAEAEWMGLHAAATGYTGFLRWAYDSWTEDPLYDTNHVTWPAGDCFLVYPNARNSVRFERLREGIQDFEKIRLLREVAGRSESKPLQERMKALDAVLGRLSDEAAAKAPVGELVIAARHAIDEASVDARP